MYRAKECTVCKRIVHMDLFNVNRAKSDGLSGHCRPCDRLRQRKWKADHREVVSERNRLIQLEKHGWTDAARTERHEALGGLCENPQCGRKIQVNDHDHQTGLGRWLLCHGCNVSLGSLGEDVERIFGLGEMLADYQLALAV